MSHLFLLHSISKLCLNFFFCKALKIYFQVNGLENLNEKVCYAVGVILHYSLITSFFIMTYIAGDILLVFSNICSSWYTRVKKQNNIYLCWFLGGLYIAICVCLDLFTDLDITYGSDRGICFLQPNYYLMMLFVIPVISLVSVNFILFLISIISIYCNMIDTANGIQKEKVFIFAKIFSLMGVTWLIGLVPSIIQIPEMWYLFIATNALQGL